MSMSSIAASERSRSPHIPEDPRTEGAGPEPDEATARPVIPPGVAPGIPVPIVELDDGMPPPESDDPVVYISNLPGPLWSIPPRQISRAVSPGLPPHLSSIRRAQEEVFGHWFDQQTSKQPPPPKTAEQMTVNFECKICLEQISSIVFLPCRHLMACEWCAKKLRQENGRLGACPICRTDISHMIPVFCP